MRKFLEKFVGWVKRRGIRLPYVRRARYERKVSTLKKLRGTVEQVREENAALTNMLLLPARALAANAKATQVIRIDPAEADELCLFVTHAPTPALKQHVVDHVNSLIDENVAVILVVNTDHHASEFSLGPDFASRLRGLLVRQNVGFDFAGWAHALGLLPHGMPRRRLYFVNDSIVGPIDRALYRTTLERIRRSKADMIGLTLNTKPKPHLQSFYLVFNERLFKSPLFANVMGNVLNLPSKNAVIDAYEIQLTGYFQEHGFRCEAIFPTLTRDDLMTNDTFYHWDRLVKIGFPFVKTNVLQQVGESAAISRLVPDRYR